MRSGFLLDTSFASELAPGRPSLPSGLDAWIIANDFRFHLPTVVVVEIRSGIEKLRRGGTAARANAYEEWLAHLIALFDGRILDLTVEIADAAGRIADEAYSEGVYPGFADVAIAATAAVHSLTILTRNVKHFEKLSVSFADPFKALPR